MAPFPSFTSKYRTKLYDSIDPSRPELSVKGKTVVITGGGTGIGAETAHYFAEAGASRIALLGRRKQPLLDTKASIERTFTNVEVFTAPTDVAKKDQVDGAIAKFAGDGKIDIVISNAAKTGPLDPVKDVDPEEFLDGVEQNLKGAMYIAQAFLRHAAADAVAINVSSSAAHLNLGAGFSAYIVAKLAVYRLWDCLAVGNPSIRVFHLQPGVVDTDMNRAAGGVAAVGHADDVSLPAGFMVWLTSTEARFLRGKFLWANWDVDELKAKADEIEATTVLNIGLVGWPFQEDNWKFESTGADPRWKA